MPLKKSTKEKCVVLSRKCEFVRICSPFSSFVVAGCSAPSPAPSVERILGLVSGKYKYKYIVSTTIKNNEKPAAVANGLAATVDTLAKAAPSAGPNVNAIEKQAPTMAMVAPRCFSSLISAAMAVANWTFPSLNPATILLARKVRKSVAATQSATDAMFPAIDHNNAVLRPYLSDRAPMKGEAMAWSKEKRLPSAPPRRTMS